MFETLRVLTEDCPPTELPKRFELIRQWILTGDACLSAAHNTGAASVIRFFVANAHNALSSTNRPLHQYPIELWNLSFLEASRPAISDRPDGSSRDPPEICRNYNRGRCNRINCRWHHECILCGGDHPAHQCK